MTPLHLEIILHYATLADDFDAHRIKLPVVSGAITWLFSEGMLEPGDKLMWQITDKGKFWLEHLLTIPFPELRWEIPAQ